jgi:hypothetical protein
VPLGSWTLETVGAPGRYVTYNGNNVSLAVLGAGSQVAARERATLTAVRGLADPACVSFRTVDGEYLRHASFQLRHDPDDGRQLFREDATFCPHAGSVAHSVTFRSSNYPSLVLRDDAGVIRLEEPQNTASFAAESSFVLRAPWAS